MNLSVGITTTVPIEVIFAAGLKPVDLNNLFISSPQYGDYIDLAERAGFPKSLCSWIKGIYGVALSQKIKKIVGVVEGDCSSTGALMSVLQSESIEMIPFSYPHSRSKEAMAQSITALCDAFGVSLESAEQWRFKLNRIRLLAKEADRLTWQEGKVSGLENHLAQVSLSDFNGGKIEDTERDLHALIQTAGSRQARKGRCRIGMIGVPPMTLDLFEVVESFDARVVYNEVQREFAFPRCEQAGSLVEQYLDYTYPYSIDFRIAEIQKQIALRKIDALIHYTQSFCHRAVDDIVIRRRCPVPVLTIEGDRSNRLDARTRLRLEAFLDMLADSTVRGVQF